MIINVCIVHEIYTVTTMIMVTMMGGSSGGGDGKGGGQGGMVGVWCGVNENGGDNDDDLLVVFSDVHFQHSWNSQMMKMSW